MAISYAVLKWRKTIKHMVDEEKQLVLRHYPSPSGPPSPLSSTITEDPEKSSSDSTTTNLVEERFNRPSQTPLPPPYASSSMVDPEEELKTAARKSLKFAPSYNSMGFRCHRVNQPHSPINQLILNKPCEIFFQPRLNVC